MPADLEQQLATYGRWLERECATTLRPAPPSNPVGTSEPTQFVEIGSRRPTHRRSAIAAVAAVSIVVVGLIGVAVTVRRSPAPPAAVSVRVDPPGPLYVLPDDVGVSVSNGHVSLLRSEPLSSNPSAGYAAVVGTSVDDGFEDLATLVTSADFDVSSDSWVDGTHGGFPTRTFDQDFTTWIAQDRGAWWIIVQTGPGLTDDAHDVLDHVTIDPSGQIAVDADSTRKIVDGFSLTGIDLDEFTATWVATIDGAGDPNVEVTTAAFPGLVVPPGGSIARVEPTTINGVRAWRMIAGDDPPVSNSSQTDATVELRTGVQWQFSPNRTVFVGGSVDADTIERFATTLTQVTAQDWATALPGFTTECTLRQRCTELSPDPAVP